MILSRKRQFYRSSGVGNQGAIYAVTIRHRMFGALVHSAGPGVVGCSSLSGSDLLMPHKHNSDRRHHIPKMSFKVRNWPAYEAGLRRRGSLTLWVEDIALEDRQTIKPSGQARYTSVAIQTSLMLRARGGNGESCIWRSMPAPMIVAQTLTDQDTDDPSQVAPLLDQIDAPIGQVTADGAYDGAPTYQTIAAHGDEIDVVIPPGSTAVGSGEPGPPTQRDRHLAMIAERGRPAWQATTGYGQRSLVETTMGRLWCTWPIRSEVSPGCKLLCE
jgi:hypothetical protein